MSYNLRGSTNDLMSVISSPIEFLRECHHVSRQSPEILKIREGYSQSLIYIHITDIRKQARAFMYCME